MSKILACLLAFLGSFPLHADVPETIEASSFTAHDWTRGLHLLAGLGANATYFKSAIADRKYGVGFNIYTGVDYYFLDSYAFEISTEVLFDKIDGILVWDTLGEVGFRIRLPYSLGPDRTVPFLRLFAGKGPTVLIYNGDKPQELELDGDRTQLEGEIYGLAYGIFQKAKDGTTWFIEVSGKVHNYRKLEAIDEVDKVPEVILSRNVRAHSAAYSLNMTLGVVVF